ILGNGILIYDLLTFALMKTKKPGTRRAIQQELARLKSIGIQKLRLLSLQFPQVPAFRRSALMSQIRSEIGPHYNTLVEIIMFYSLAIPSKARPNMHLKTSHGMPPETGAEYEQSEIEEGERIAEGDAFR